MGWLSGLFKGKVDVGNVVDSVISAGDKLVFTKEEKAEFNKEMADKLAQYTKDTLSENTIRSKARRFIAILIISNAVITFWVCAYLQLRGIDPKFILELFLGVFGSTSVVMVLAFFFGGYYAKGISLVKDKKK
jgi:hypothetical protein